VSARKGWLLAMSVVVITLLSFGWFMLMRPPFRFLAGAERVEFNELDGWALGYRGPPARSIIETFRSKRPFDELAKEAKGELEKAGYTSNWDGGWRTEPGLWSSFSQLYFEPGREGVTITILREPGPLDRIRLRLFNARPGP
jgi:hypothetical protein